MKALLFLAVAGVLTAAAVILALGLPKADLPSQEDGAAHTAGAASSGAGEVVSEDVPSDAPRTAAMPPSVPPAARAAERREQVASVREEYRRVLESERRSAEAGAPTGPAPSAATPTAAVSAPDVTVVPDAVATVDQPRLWLPAAMLEPDASIPITNELQVAEWEQLQEEFVQAVKGRAPATDAEKDAWVQAQLENDDLFRAKFGWEAFRQQQLKAYMEGLAPAPPP